MIENQIKHSCSRASWSFCAGDTVRESLLGDGVWPFAPVTFGNGEGYRATSRRVEPVIR